MSTAPGALPHRGRAALFVVLAGAAFATSGPLARAGRPLHPFLIAFGRVALAALVLVVADRRHLLASIRGLTRRQLATAGVAGLLLALHFDCFLWGLDHTSLPAAVSLVSLEPLGVVVSAWAILGIAPTRPEWVGVGLATAGAVVVALGSGVGDHQLTGDLVVVAAVALYGLYLAAARALKDALPARSYVALVYTSASFALALLLVAVPPAFAAPSWPPTTHSLLAVLALGVVPTLLGHSAVQTASRSLPPAVVALVSPGETVGGIALGAIFLGAKPTSLELLGALVILAGAAVAIAIKPPRTR